MAHAFSAIVYKGAPSAALVLLVGACSATDPAATAAPPFAGTIVSGQPGSFIAHPMDGPDRTVTIDAKTKILEVSKADLNDIQANSFLGATATPSSDGSLIATEVHLFDERLRGIGEGHRTLPTSTESSMTNGAVATSLSTGTTSNRPKAASDTQMLVIRYKGGEQKIRVPSGVPIAFIAPGSTALLRPRVHVVVVPTSSSGIRDTAGVIKVGKAGFVPPL